MPISFSFQARRSPLPMRFRKRVAFRNSKIRQEVSGFGNYERLYFLGMDVTLEWGVYDPAKPSTSHLRTRAST